MTATTMLVQIDAWVQARWLRPLDHGFAAFLAREAPDADPLLLLAAALASHQLGRGHVCLDLRAALADAAQALALPPEDEGGAQDGAPAATPADLLARVRLAQWQSALRHPRLVAGGEGATPLVLIGTRLYLRRYWEHERSVREAIAQLLDYQRFVDHAVACAVVLPVVPSTDLHELITLVGFDLVTPTDRGLARVDATGERHGLR